MRAKRRLPRCLVRWTTLSLALTAGWAWPGFPADAPVATQGTHGFRLMDLSGWAPPDSTEELAARLSVVPGGRQVLDGVPFNITSVVALTGMELARDGQFWPAEWEGLARYLEVLPLPGGGFRIWYEARLPDESHELRTELISG